MAKRRLVLGTAGHIDHGKTQLVKALTGTNTARQKEEIQRGITIDLGFADTNLGGFEVGFVDVPGHERFVKNMLAGTTGVQFILLVVAADESIMPQTIEHFHICRLLGIPRGMVVITKKNSVDSDLLRLVEEEVQDLIAGSFLNDSPIVAVDSVSGDGIAFLRKILTQQLSSIEDNPNQSQTELFRLPIDRVFSLRGFGTIVTGTPCGGTIEKEDKVQAYPGNLLGRVRNIQIYGEPSASGTVGNRLALNLVGIEKDALQRGTVLALPGTLSPTYMLDVHVELLEDTPAALKIQSPIRLHQGSSEIIGRFYPVGGRRELAPGESGLAQIRLERPTTVCVGDRFILRRYSPMTTIGGGLVLDPIPLKTRGLKSRQLTPLLQKLSQDWETGSKDKIAQTLDYLISRSGPAGISFDQLSSCTGYTPDHIIRLLNSQKNVILIRPPGVAVNSEQLEKLKNCLLSEIGSHHANYPLAPGVFREELKGKVMGHYEGTYYTGVLRSLELDGLIRISTHTVSLPDHTVTLTPEQQKITEKILNTFSKEQAKAMTLQQVAFKVGIAESGIRDLFFFLVQKGSITRISEEFFLAFEQLEFIRRLIKENLPSGSSFSIGEFKDLFHITRRLAIPLLEFLDRSHITRRVGNDRQVI
jgi:selenocysteine-specific elongation factor